MNVFVSGSISIKRLPFGACQKLDSIIEKQMTVLVGDASGIDSQVQKYLAQKNYNNVYVYYVGTKIRHNFGNWKTVNVYDTTCKGRELYILKDMKMANDADYGMMIWDKKSPGTYKNIEEMIKLNKHFYVIFNELIVSDKNFNTINKATDQEQQLNLF
jgi:hypothetical protein